MSEYEPFPSQDEVSDAYRAVLLANQLTGLGSLAAEMSKDEPDELWEGQTETAASLNLEFGKIFGDMGIVLVVSNTETSISSPPLVRANRIVPELLNPERFIDYLGHVGVNSVYSDETHWKLAEDVVEHIHSAVCNCEGIINFLEQPPIDEYEMDVSEIREIRNAYLDTFRMLMPFYFNAEFHEFMDTYEELEERILSDSSRSS